MTSVLASDQVWANNLGRYTGTVNLFAPYTGALTGAVAINITSQPDRRINLRIRSISGTISGAGLISFIAGTIPLGFRPDSDMQYFVTGAQNGVTGYNQLLVRNDGSITIGSVSAALNSPANLPLGVCWTNSIDLQYNAA